MAYELAGSLPVGTKLAWLKSFTNTPALGAGIVEMNGQTLSDAQSIFNGQVIPNLNTGTQCFGRGATTSGGTGGSDTHTHNVGTQNDSTGSVLSGTSICFLTLTPYLLASANIDPTFYEVVWIFTTHPFRLVPVGAIIPWLKSFTSVPTLLDNYVECNGQSLSDAQSIFNGQTIPNLNGASAGTQRFLRGSSTSGTTGGAATHTHARGASDVAGFVPDSTDPVLLIYAPDGMYTFSNSNNLPQYYEVVYVMRVK